jgi:hypothetical protein
MIKVYMDESGVHDGSPVVTVGAYFGRPKQWETFTKRWNAKKRPIKVYHATDAQNLRGEFKGWDNADRDKLVAGLLPVIPASGIAGIVIGIQMDQFSAEMKIHPDLRKMFGSPYTACFQWTVQRTLELQRGVKNRERLAFFHERNDYETEATDSFEWVKKNGNAKDIEMSLKFGTKQDYVPLQAADVLAYEGNRRLRDPDRPERKSFKALSPKNGRLHVQYYGKKMMPWLIERLQKIKDGTLGLD